MTTMKRIKIELWSVGFAVAVMALFAGRSTADRCPDSGKLTASQARAEAAVYLGTSPTDARLDPQTQRWEVTDGHSTAWLDARSGQLLEVEFDPPGATTRGHVRP